MWNLDLIPTFVEPPKKVLFTEQNWTKKKTLQIIVINILSIIHMIYITLLFSDKNFKDKKKIHYQQLH